MSERLPAQDRTPRASADRVPTAAPALSLDNELDWARAYISDAEEGFWTYDSVKNDLRYTARVAEILGTEDPGEMLATWHARVHPDDVPRLRAEIGALAMDGSTSTTCEVRIRHTDGSYRWIKVRATIHERDGQRTLGGSVLDVTERHRTEDVFERLVHQNALILNAAAEGIMCVNDQGDISFANPSAATLLGQGVPDVVGKPLCRYMHACGYDGSDRSAHTPDCPIREALTHPEQAERQTHRFVSSDDNAIDVEFVASPVRQPGGETGIVLVMNDVTHRRAQERRVHEIREKLARSEKLTALGTLVSGVGHELRTPMSYINNHLFLIQRKVERLIQDHPDLAEVGADIIHRCNSSMKGITRMSTLLDDLRESYKPDEAEFQLRDVREVVHKAQQLFHGAYEGPVKVELDLHDAGEVPLQSGRIQQVVINLLNNAAEAMKDGGKIRLSTQADGDAAVIVVEDDGPGMTHEVQRTIFNPFFTTKREGSGLGLYLVKQIIDRHMGQITCTSEPGRGTTFRVRLTPGEPVESQARSRVDQIQAILREQENDQEATVDVSTPMPSTSNSTSSPGAR